MHTKVRSQDETEIERVNNTFELTKQEFNTDLKQYLDLMKTNSTVHEKKIFSDRHGKGAINKRKAEPIATYFAGILQNATKQEKRYIARRAREVQNAKQAALDIELNEILNSSSKAEISKITASARAYLNINETHGQEEGASGSESDDEELSQDTQDSQESQEESQDEQE